MTTEIVIPRAPTEFDAVRTLCWEYRDFLLSLGGIDRVIVETFYPEDTYRSVLAAQETEYSPPHGATRLALLDGAPVACGMYHQIAPGDVEIKRVFVQDRARGTGLGRQMMEALIDQARADGAARVLMDTGKPLVVAQRLYEDMGFKRRGPYQTIPEIALPRLVFYEMVF